MISSEMPELIMNASRVLVLRGGRISGELEGAAINEEMMLARAHDIMSEGSDGKPE